TGLRPVRTADILSAVVFSCVAFHSKWGATARVPPMEGAEWNSAGRTDCKSVFRMGKKGLYGPSFFPKVWHAIARHPERKRQSGSDRGISPNSSQPERAFSAACVRR